MRGGVVGDLVTAAGHLRYRLLLRWEITPTDEEGCPQAETVKQIQQPWDTLVIRQCGRIRRRLQPDTLVVDPKLVNINLEGAEWAVIRHVGCPPGFWIATNPSPLLFINRVSFQRRLIVRRL